MRSQVCNMRSPFARHCTKLTRLQVTPRHIHFGVNATSKSLYTLLLEHNFEIQNSVLQYCKYVPCPQYHRTDLLKIISAKSIRHFNKIVTVGHVINESMSEPYLIVN